MTPKVSASQAMLVGSQLPDNPKDIIYSQIRECLYYKSRGYDAAEAMVGLMALIEPWKDDAWFHDMKAMKEGDDIFWANLEAVVRLLHRKNLWATPPRAVKEGMELAEAI